MTNSLKQAARQALEALERIANPAGDWPASVTARRNDAIKSLRAALSEPEAVQVPPCSDCGIAVPSETVLTALRDALLALTFCGKSAQARALNAQAARRIKAVLGAVQAAEPATGVVTERLLEIAFDAWLEDESGGHQRRMRRVADVFAAAWGVNLAAPHPPAQAEIDAEIDAAFMRGFKAAMRQRDAEYAKGVSCGLEQAAAICAGREDLTADRLRREIEALRPPAQAERTYPLPDDLYPGSKYWMASDYAGRVEWLHVMYESKKRELEAFLAQAEARGDEPVAWLIDWPDEPELGHYFAEEPNEGARSRPLYTRPAQAAPQAGEAEPLFLLHTGQIDGSGEQDEWDTEANSWTAVEEFCRQHPGKTIGLYPASQPMSREGVSDPETVSLIEECRDAFDEELSAWDLDPPLHHVQQGYEKCVAWLSAHGIGSGSGSGEGVA